MPRYYLSNNSYYACALFLSRKCHGGVNLLKKNVITMYRAPRTLTPLVCEGAISCGGSNKVCDNAGATEPI